MKKLLLAAVTLAFTQAHAAESLLERINNHGTVTVGTEGTYAPFTYHDESGKLTGYDVEVTRCSPGSRRNALIWSPTRSG